MVQDVDRPDVQGVAPKMQAICVEVREAFEAMDRKPPFLRIKTDDNFLSNVCIQGSLDPREDWQNGIWENSHGFRFSIVPMKVNKKTLRYYDESQPKVCVSLQHEPWRLEKRFRTYTGPVDKVIAKIIEWFDEIWLLKDKKDAK